MKILDLLLFKKIKEVDKEIESIEEKIKNTEETLLKIKTDSKSLLFKDEIIRIVEELMDQSKMELHYQNIRAPENIYLEQEKIRKTYDQLLKLVDEILETNKENQK
jgi:hypothetical protein